MDRVGILITHGTDTLAWTHAFVRYAIKNNHANIVLTGSQIPMPSVGEFSDAYENLENSMRFLTSMVPPNIITVFNYGKEAFSDSLSKIRRWEIAAFIGDTIARMEWDEIKYHDESVEICEPEPLDKFYLITTGGTIEAEYNQEGILVPGQNHVLSYITRRFSNYFKDLSQDPVFAIDSSDMTFERMRRIVEVVVRCLKETNPHAYADLKFEKQVKIIYTDPFKELSDYQREIENSKGIIIAGYGGGNVTTDPHSTHNLIPLVKELFASGIPVVLSSQVPIGPADFIYENAYNVIKEGALSGVDLSLPECQVRLSYLLGHKKEMEEFCDSNNIKYEKCFETLFVSGMKFRTKRSKSLYENLKSIQIPQNDLLIDYDFSNSMEMIIKWC